MIDAGVLVEPFRIAGLIGADICRIASAYCVIYVRLVRAVIINA